MEHLPSYNPGAQARADRVTTLIGEGISKNEEEWKEVLEEEPYALTDRIRYFNRAAMSDETAYITEDGSVDLTCVRSIPLYELAVLVQNGLLGRADHWTNRQDNFPSNDNLR